MWFTVTPLSSRPPFNDDPTPWRSPVGGQRSERRMHAGWWWDPRPQFTRRQTNSTNVILDDLREAYAHEGRLTARHAARYLAETDIADIPAPPAHLDHARVVLTRLASQAVSASQR